MLDEWAEWLLHRKHGGDPQLLRRQLDFLGPVRDQVLDNAAIAPGETLLDVGAGDGLIAFGALERVGPTGRVIFDDISQDLLDRARSLAATAGVLDRCEFIRASADDLSALEDTSVDAVTTRSVLIYVGPKAKAIAEFHRVLKPGGRLSVYEPINRFAHRRTWQQGFFGIDVRPVADVWAKVRALYDRLQPESDPMLDFDERDLFELAEAAGFAAGAPALRGGGHTATGEARLGASYPLGWESEDPDARRGDGPDAHGRRAGASRRARPPATRERRGRLAERRGVPLGPKSARGLELLLEARSA